jgi:hypothetical protein
MGREQLVETWWHQLSLHFPDLDLKATLLGTVPAASSHVLDPMRMKLSFPGFDLMATLLGTTHPACPKTSWT